MTDQAVQVKMSLAVEEEELAFESNLLKEQEKKREVQAKLDEVA